MWKIETFERLGKELLRGVPQDIVTQAIAENPMFTKENVEYAISSIASQMLSKEVLESWSVMYENVSIERNVGVIAAGNIPLVSFADIMCVAITGGTIFLKPSSKDRVLIHWICGLLTDIDSSIKVDPLEETSPLDVLIATGGDNAGRYFESRYSDIPKMVRSHRESIAIVDNDTSDDEMIGLWDDVFTYFGLGCRNVSRIFVPSEDTVSRIVELWNKTEKDITHSGFMNSYFRSKALLTINGEKFADGGYYTISFGERGVVQLSEIIATVYDQREDVDRWIEHNEYRIQCIVCEKKSHPRAISFGQAQKPMPWDYADGVDVIHFLKD